MDHTKLIAPCGMDCRLCQAFQGKGFHAKDAVTQVPGNHVKTVLF